MHALACHFVSFYLRFPIWKLEIRILTSCYRATDEEHQVRIRVKVKLVLFTFHCNELGSSLVLLISLCYLYFCPTDWCARGRRKRGAATCMLLYWRRKDVDYNTSTLDFFWQSYILSAVLTVLRQSFSMSFTTFKDLNKHPKPAVPW